MLVALILGTLLALAALAFVLYPLFFGTRRAMGRAAALAEIDAVAVLREIEFDRETGKLSDADYSDLRAAYSPGALEQIRARSPVTPSVAEDAAEAAVTRMRRRLACASCGPRPESDARWCSTCGNYLPGNCEACRAEVREPGARFCSRCGDQLAA